jgi:hypothetical protein
MAEARGKLDREKIAGNTTGKSTQKTTPKTREKATGKTAGKAAVRTARKAGGSVARKRAARRETPAGVDGLELLREKADQRLARKSTKLAAVLEKKALAGDVPSAKLLMVLAERKRPRELPVKKPSAAAFVYKLETEPRWEGTEEQGVGNRE